MSGIVQIVHAIEGYDPDALHVEKARAAIRACLAPVTQTQRLPVREALGDHDLAVAKTGDQPHPVFSLVRRAVLDHLAQFLSSGGRKIDAWYATLKVVEVSFDDEADAFRNINTREELKDA